MQSYAQTGSEMEANGRAHNLCRWNIHRTGEVMSAGQFIFVTELLTSSKLYVFLAEESETQDERVDT